MPFDTSIESSIDILKHRNVPTQFQGNRASDLVAAVSVSAPELSDLLIFILVPRSSIKIGNSLFDFVICCCTILYYLRSYYCTVLFKNIDISNDILKINGNSDIILCNSNGHENFWQRWSRFVLLPVMVAQPQFAVCLFFFLEFSSSILSGSTQR